MRLEYATSVHADFAPTEVIHQNEYDVRLDIALRLANRRVGKSSTGTCSRGAGKQFAASHRHGLHAHELYHLSTAL